MNPNMKCYIFSSLINSDQKLHENLCASVVGEFLILLELHVNAF